jgi:transcription-repair coupling factor (superfamily II helicase)
LPESYCGDVHERLVLYKRLANCVTEEELERLTEELVDRFGPLPEPTRVLLECHKLRILGAPLGVMKIDAAPGSITVQFIPEPPVEPKKVLALVQSSRIYRLPGPDRVKIEMKHEDLKQRASEVRQFLRKLA